MGDDDSGENYSVTRYEGERDAYMIASYHQLLPGFVTHCVSRCWNDKKTTTN